MGVASGCGEQEVGVVNSLWTGPIIFNFRAH